MMWRKALLATALIVTSSAAMSETVAVLGGEHEGFTRLVMTLPDGSKHKTRQTKDKVTVEVTSDKDVSFDLSKAFQRISRNRIATIEQEGRSTLILTLGCDCIVNSFQEQSRLLVLDVKPGQVRDSEQTESRSSSNPRPETRLPLNLGYVTTGTQIAAEEISEAISKNLLVAAETQGKTTSEGSAPKKMEQVLFPNQNVNSYGYERATEQTREKAANCTTPSSLAFLVGVSVDEAKGQTGSLHAGLYGPDGQLVPEGVLALAQQQIALGLGEEALLTLSLMPAADAEAEYLRQFVAAIMLQRTQPTPELEEHEPCGDLEFMASKLAQPKMALGSNEGPRILRALDALPRTLLKIVGPPATSMLHSSNLDALALESVKLRERALPGESPKMIDTKFAESSREKAKQIEDIIETNGDDSPEALAEAILTKAEGGEEISQQDVDLASSHLYERAPQTEMETLRKAEIFGLVSLGNFNGALEALEEFSDNPTKTDQVADHIFSELAAQDDDVVFLSIVARKRDQYLTSLSDDVKATIARRLYVLGFSEEGDAIYRSLPKPSSELTNLAVQAHTQDVLYENIPWLNENATSLNSYYQALRDGALIEALPHAPQDGLLIEVQSQMAQLNVGDQTPSTKEKPLGKAQKLSLETETDLTLLSEILDLTALTQ